MTSPANNTNEPKIYYWIILIGLLIFSLTTGIIGYQNYFIQERQGFDWFRTLYCTLQLFVFENGDLPGHIPWELQAARFVAPLTAVMTLIMAFLEIFREQLSRFKIARMKNHVVIIGFGIKGLNIMEENLHNREKILIIEKDPLNPHLASIKPPACHLLTGDADNRNILKKARIAEAKAVFLLMGDDAKQVSACLMIYKLIKESRRDENKPLNCVMHLQKQDFLNTMRSHNLVQNKKDGFTLSIFNVYENSARQLFKDNPPDRKGIASDSENYINIIILGFGNTGEALALQTALTGHYLNGRKPQVVIFDRIAKNKVTDFLTRYPTYQEYSDLKYEDMDANSPQMIPRVAEYLEDPRAINTLVLCMENKTQNLLLGLELEGLKLEGMTEPLQIFARTNDNESLLTLSREIKPYGMPSKVCSQEVIIGGDLDRNARAIHENYLRMRRLCSDFGTNEADVNWENLSQEFRDSNRKAADHLGVKIRGIGCCIVSAEDPRPAVIFSEEEIEKLSELEHRRWNAERSLAGWSYSERKSIKTKKTPYLIDWKNLSEQIREFDRDSVRNITGVLDLEGLKAVRRATAE